MAVPYQNPRGTRTALNAKASGNTILPGQVYLITDESRLAIGLTVGSYSAFIKQGEVLTIPTGTLTAPGLSLSGDADTGVYTDAADTIGFVVGGSFKFEVNPTQILIRNALRGISGTAASPGMGFSADTNTGIFRIGDDNIGITVGGTTAVDINSTRTNITSGSLQVGGNTVYHAGNLSIVSTGSPGLVPATVTSNTTDFLRRDGTWATPPTGSGSGSTPGWIVTATGTGASQDIALNEAIAADQLLVFVRGIRQRPGIDYTVNVSTLTITTENNGDNIDIIKPATNPSIVGWTGGIDGLMADNEIINLGFAPLATTLTSARCSVWALTGATNSVTLTLYKKTSAGAAPVSVGTAVFSAGGQGDGQAATVSVSGTIEEGAQVYLAGPATADATLANINYMFR